VQERSRPMGTLFRACRQRWGALALAALVALVACSGWLFGALQIASAQSPPITVYGNGNWSPQCIVAPSPYPTTAGTFWFPACTTSGTTAVTPTSGGNAQTINTYGGANVTLVGQTNGNSPVIGSGSTDGSNNNGLYTNSYLYGYNGTSWDRGRKDPYAAGPLWVTNGGGTTAAIASGTAGPTVIKATAGRLMRLVATTTGATTSITFYDNASACSGTIIAILPITVPLGTFIDAEMPAVNGITACGGTGSAAVTVSYW
jgi:hypothetical protein